MRKFKYLILGAGPSGLSFAHRLLQENETSFLIIEKEPEPGGLCRSRIVDGFPLDIGGGHFLDIKNRKVLDFMFRFLPESEWKEFKRVSKINLHDMSIDYPFEAHLWQLPIDLQIDYLESVAKAGCINNQCIPDNFSSWINWKLGNYIAENYMLPYNRKIWSTDLSLMGTYWLDKLPDVSFRETLRSCLLLQTTGSIPAHATFLYPKNYGYGEVWRRMGSQLGEHLITGYLVDKLDISNRVVNDKYKADFIINTVPWTSIKNISDLPEFMAKSISSLQHTSISVDYYRGNINSDAHWIYDPNEDNDYHRILCRHNFIENSNGHWKETNSKRLMVKSEWRYDNDFAYPLNLKQKPEAINSILAWAKESQVYGLGRWGEWEHMNSDIAVAKGIALADMFLQNRTY